MLSISNVTYRIGGRALLENATAVISAGHRVGLVGRNGAGKSTLFGLILGESQPDQGEIEIQKGVRIGIVAQEAPGGAMTPQDVVLAADLERAALLHEADHSDDGERLAEVHMRLVDIDAHTAPARASEILAGLGFSEEMQQQPMSSFSGGWRMRVALAAALFAQPELLLLDEPTNHLDLEATVWLEAYLQKYPHTLLVISHDRAILNACVDHILHLDSRQLTFYTGNYDWFEKMREERMAQSKSEAAKLDAKRKHLQSFVDRFKAKATKARQAQSRMKMLAKLGSVSVMRDDPTVSFDFPEPAELSPPLISFDKVSVGYIPGKPVLRDIDLRIDPEDRIALLGSNGNGKSTFAKLVAGRLQPMEGHHHRSGKLFTGFFAQHQVEDMDGESTPFKLMAELMPGGREPQVRARLGRFGFGQEKANTQVKSLSGGERARLNFALITHAAPPMLIFDEPTNHLDIESREALAVAINEYKGAVILISHDWHLLELTADQLWLVGDGKVKPFDGDLEDYRKLMLGKSGSGNTKIPKDKRPKNKPAETPQPERPRGGDRRKELDALRKLSRDAEAALARLTQDKASVEKSLLEPHLDGGRRGQLMRRQNELATAVARAEEAWLEAAEALETAAA
ncbi:MAG TPA: ABC-F family ATP-binding cassette domain-containing protein [Aliidongia sp.]|uniref:ABC-F family ATP-binding cassette domain-containing protein n=1 Tax=Aliidongia sp. TaxID=1914230 RepID=UPI002DDCE7CE|nr:ABC-F family ATP-binding cassette domain-containing protein [Aliidongia sp.]HEV2675584.1 ABC-F family ATP-binding cassette domain-containing protein [Aliidongia sp.]